MNLKTIDESLAGGGENLSKMINPIKSKIKSVFGNEVLLSGQGQQVKIHYQRSKDNFNDVAIGEALYYFASIGFNITFYSESNDVYISWDKYLSRGEEFISLRDVGDIDHDAFISSWLSIFIKDVYDLNMVWHLDNNIFLCKEINSSVYIDSVSKLNKRFNSHINKHILINLILCCVLLFFILSITMINL